MNSKYGGSMGQQRLIKTMKSIGGESADEKSAGATGLKGDTGATGPAGPVGPAGPAGQDGQDGTNGTDASITFGSITLDYLDGDLQDLLNTISINMEKLNDRLDRLESTINGK